MRRRQRQTTLGCHLFFQSVSKHTDMQTCIKSLVKNKRGEFLRMFVSHAFKCDIPCSKAHEYKKTKIKEKETRPFYNCLYRAGWRRRPISDDQTAGYFQTLSRIHTKTKMITQGIKAFGQRRKKNIVRQRREVSLCKQKAEAGLWVMESRIGAIIVPTSREYLQTLLLRCSNRISSYKFNRDYIVCAYCFGVR